MHAAREGRPRRGRHPPHARAHRARDRGEARRPARRARRASTAAARTSPRRLHAPGLRPARRARSRSATSTSPSTATTSPRAAPTPVVHATHLASRSRTTRVVLVDDVLFTGRTVRAGDRRAVRLRAPRARPARRARRPRPPRAARSAPTTSARTCRPRAPSASTCASSEVDGVDEVDHRRACEEAIAMRHLLSIEDLDRADIERILDRAESFTEVSEREIKKVPALRGRRVLNLFYEASTRTRSSFELAAKTPVAPTSSTSPPAARASRRASRSRTPSRRSRPTSPT